MLATFLSHPVVWSTSLIELLTLLSVVALASGAYRHVECHHSGCHRFGRFPHGPYKLCRLHHPHIPSTGRIDMDRIREVAPTTGAERPHVEPDRVE